MSRLAAPLAAQEAHTEEPSCLQPSSSYPTSYYLVLPASSYHTSYFPLPPTTSYLPLLLYPPTSDYILPAPSCLHSPYSSY